MINYFKDIFWHSPFSGSFELAALVFVIVIALILVALYKREPLPVLELSFAFVMGKYVLWGFIQELILVSVFYVLNHFLNLQASILISALLFGLVAHFSNRLLMGWCMALALIFLSHWNVYHNVYALGICHGVVATIFEYIIPQSLTERMKTWTR